MLQQLILRSACDMGKITVTIRLASDASSWGTIAFYDSLLQLWIPSKPYSLGVNICSYSAPQLRLSSEEWCVAFGRFPKVTYMQSSTTEYHNLQTQGFANSCAWIHVWTLCSFGKKEYARIIWLDFIASFFFLLLQCRFAMRNSTISIVN